MKAKDADRLMDIDPEALTGGLPPLAEPEDLKPDEVEAIFNEAQIGMSQVMGGLYELVASLRAAAESFREVAETVTESMEADRDLVVQAYQNEMAASDLADSLSAHFNNGGNE